MDMERRGFLGTIIGGGLALPQSIGKIVEPTPREVEQVMKEKPSGIAVVSGQEIIADEITWFHEIRDMLDNESVLKSKFQSKLWTKDDWRLEVVFENSFGQPETLTVRPKQNAGESMAISAW